MVPSILSTTPTETWVEAEWDDFLTFADDPALANGRFYYDRGSMRIEMSPLGSSHGRDNSVISTVVVLYAAMKVIPILEFTNTTLRKIRVQEAQPDIAFYVGKNLKFLPRSNAPINLSELEPPSLVVEIAVSSLEDDKNRKQKLYQRMGVSEYWVVDVNAGQVLAFALSQTDACEIRDSLVLPGLSLALVEEALQRSQTEDDGAISRWLISTLQQ